MKCLCYRLAWYFSMYYSLGDIVEECSGVCTLECFIEECCFWSYSSLWASPRNITEVQGLLVRMAFAKPHFFFFFFFCTSPGSVTKLNDCSANTWKCWSRLTFSKVLFIAEQLLRWARWLLQLKAHMEWMISRSYSQEPVRHMQRLPSFRQILHTCCLPCCLDRCLWVHTNLASTKGPFPRGTVPENHGLPPIIACLLCTFHVHRCRCCYVGAVFPAAHLGPPSFSFTLHIFTHCHFDIRSIVFAQIWRKGQGHRLFDNSDIV